MFKVIRLCAQCSCKCVNIPESLRAQLLPKERTSNQFKDQYTRLRN